MGAEHIEGAAALVQEPVQPEVDYKAQFDNLSQTLQTVEQRAKAAEAKASFLEQQMLVSQQQAPQFAPDDYLTAGQTEEVVRRENAKLEQGLRQNNIIFSELQAKQKYSDYDEVLKHTALLAAENPEYRDMIRLSSNPAEVAYRLGLSHPEYQKKLIQSAASGVKEKIETQFNRPPTLDGISGSAVKAGAEDIWNMSKEDFNKEFNKTFL